MRSGRTKSDDRRLMQDTLDDLEHRMRGDSIECGDSPHDELYAVAMDCLVAAARHRSVMRSDENLVAALLRAYMQAEKDVQMGADGPPPSWLRRLKRTAEAEAEDPEWVRKNNPRASDS